MNCMCSLAFSLWLVHIASINQTKVRYTDEKATNHYITYLRRVITKYLSVSYES